MLLNELLKKQGSVASKLWGNPPPPQIKRGEIAPMHAVEMRS